MTRLLPALALAAALASPALAAPDPSPNAPVRPPYGAPLSYAAARAALDAAVAEAKSHGWRMAVTVVEPDGSLVAFAKLDDTQYGSVEMAQHKARSAALYRRATKAMADPATGAVNVATLMLPGAVAIEGGEVLSRDGRVVGAIGVSGGTSDQDGVAARAGVAALPPR